MMISDVYAFFPGLFWNTSQISKLDLSKAFDNKFLYHFLQSSFTVQSSIVDVSHIGLLNFEALTALKEQTENKVTRSRCLYFLQKRIFYELKKERRNNANPTPYLLVDFVHKKTRVNNILQLQRRWSSSKRCVYSNNFFPSAIKTYVRPLIPTLLIRDHSAEIALSNQVSYCSD